ncbi:Bug family tripartite tricarboxylate transporter substrate binding protein [Ottowia sp.]|uniref:Bug family tripartite tricarboxylate transporter substrate binding protein n=1 Tax=Ottowia sp. TaxID=1898956 RepID=UPI0039E5423C
MTRIPPLARTAAFIGIALLLATGAQAQQPWPARPITLVVPFGPGSGTDIGTRLLSKELSGVLGVPVIVDNKPGANGAIGAQAVAKAAPDGHTLLVGSATTNALNYAFFPSKLNYKPESFVAVSGMGSSPIGLYVGADAPWGGLADLVAASKKNPGKFSCGSGNTVTQVACAVLRKRTGIDAVNAPYKSNPQALADVAGGQVTYAFSDASAAQTLVDGKKIRALAMAAEKRAAAAPNVATFGEQGVADFEFTGWTAVFAPAGTPAPVVEKLNALIRRANQSPEAAHLRAQSGSSVLDFDVATAKRFVDGEVARWGRYVKDADVKPE